MTERTRDIYEFILFAFRGSFFSFMDEETFVSGGIKDIANDETLSEETRENTRKLAMVIPGDMSIEKMRQNKEAKKAMEDWLDAMKKEEEK